MYKSYKNLKNGKIRLGREKSSNASESVSQNMSHRSRSKKLSDNSIMKSARSVKSYQKNRHESSKFNEMKERGLVSEEYDSEFNNSVSSVRMEEQNKKMVDKIIKNEMKKKKKGKPPISKNRIARNRIPKSNKTEILPKGRMSSEPRLRLQNGARLYPQNNLVILGDHYTMDKRKNRKKKKNPAKEYLKMKGHESLPVDLRKALNNKEKLNQVHLVDIYGVSGEKDIQVQKRHLNQLRSRSESVVKKRQIIL